MPHDPVPGDRPELDPSSEGVTPPLELLEGWQKFIGELQEMQRSLAERDAALNDRETALAEREDAVREKEAALVLREGAVDRQSAYLVEQTAPFSKTLAAIPDKVRDFLAHELPDLHLAQQLLKESTEEALSESETPVSLEGEAIIPEGPAKTARVHRAAIDVVSKH